MADSTRDPVPRDNLCLIIDLEGFHIGNHFEERELGYYSWRGDRGSFFFDVRTPYAKTSQRDRRTIHRVTRLITGLPYQATESEIPLHHPKALRGIVKALYKEFRTEFRTVVGFKGGTLEKSVLLDCKLPYMNIEDWGCPKYDALRDDNADVDIGCGNHADPSIHHCPQVECETFWNWTRKFLNFFKAKQCL